MRVSYVLYVMVEHDHVGPFDIDGDIDIYGEYADLAQAQLALEKVLVKYPEDTPNMYAIYKQTITIEPV